MIQACAYFGCDKLLYTEDEGFNFCELHLAYLHKLMEYENNDDMRHTISYCLSALNDKVYNNSVRLL